MYLFIMIYSTDFHCRVINIKTISLNVDSALKFQLRNSVASLCLLYSVLSSALSLTIPLRPFHRSDRPSGTNTFGKFRQRGAIYQQQR